MRHKPGSSFIRIVRLGTQGREQRKNFNPKANIVDPS